MECFSMSQHMVFNQETAEKFNPNLMDRQSSRMNEKP